MPLQVTTIFADTIEKEFKGQISPRAVKCLQLMADQVQQLEAALDAVHKQNLKIMKYLMLSDAYKAALAESQKHYEKTFDDLVGGDNVLTERAKKGDIDEQ